MTMRSQKKGRILSCFVFCYLIGLVYPYNVSDANSLHTSLFTGYNRHVLPDYPVNVQAEYNLLTINALEMRSQILTTTGWFTVLWNDSRLAWTKSSFGNIEHVYVPQNFIWHPELIVENSVIGLSNLGEDDTHIRIQYDGEVRWEPPAILSTSCDMDVTFFPYDAQTCEIELASWGFPSDTVDLGFYKSHVNLLDYRTNGEWNLISTSQHEGQIVEDNLTYSELLFTINVERLPGHYIMTVLFPVIVTAVLTSVTFILPTESGEKVGYILTVLLALAVLLTIFSDSLPTTSKHTSLLVLFLTITLGLASMVIVLTVLIIRLHHRTNYYPAPQWIHKLRECCNAFTSKETKVEALNGNESTRKSKKLIGKTYQGSESSKEVATNQELAHFLDNLGFVIFSIFYAIVMIGFTMVLALW